MNELEELIKTADRLCKNLDRAAANERQFGDEICLELERMSWSTLRMRNDLQKLKEYSK